MRDCPDREELQRLIAGSHPVDRQQFLERHLEDCERCRHLLETLADIRAVVPRSPMPPRVRMPACPALKRATERLLDDPDAETADGTVRLHIADEPGAQLPFLQPTDCPGFLGKIGPYEVRRLIGSGGSGMVFEGYDPVLKRTVAVKVLSPLLAVSDQARSRFLREAQAAAALTHEHLVTIHAVEEADGVLYLVLEYVPGESLADRLRREGRLPLATVIRIGAQVARGLAAAHEKGLVHRDIKPGNLLLEAGTDRVKVADFGLAKSADEVSLTIEGMIAGTPDFMSPEQASGAGVDARSDLFSLGAVLYTACTGSPPFRGESPLCTLERVRWESPVPLWQVDPTLPEWFCQIVHCLLEKNPCARIPSATQLAESLERQEVTLPLPVPAADRPSLKTGKPAGSAWGRLVWQRLVPGLVVWPVAIAAVAGAYIGRPDEGEREPGRAPEIGFMIVGRTETYRGLAEAFQAAGDGDVIEVYGDGPFPTPPLRTEGKRLTVRAAGSSKPLFLPATPGQRRKEPFVTADADLRLEGLELRWTLVPSPGKSEAELISRCVLVSTRGRLALTHCRIVSGRRNGCVGGSGQHMALHNCHFMSDSGMCVFWRASAGSRLDVEGCALEGQDALAVYAVPETVRPKPARLSLTRNTVATEKALHVLVDLGRKQPVTITARHNIFDSAQLVHLRPLQPPRRPDQSPTELSQFLRSFVSWTEEANLYRRGTDFVTAIGGPQPFATMSAEVGNVGQWLRMWNLPANQSVEGVINLHERTDRANLQPVRLAGVESASGPVPSGVGANAGTLGPGSAYHAWRASPAHVSWP